jgi:hypothetical protein
VDEVKAMDKVETADEVKDASSAMFIFRFQPT